MLEDLKISNIKKDKKELYYQLIKNLCQIQAQSTTETIKYKRKTNELEENIKQLQSQLKSLQTQEDDNECLIQENTQNNKLSEELQNNRKYNG